MNSAICLVVLAFCAAAMAEECHQDSDCSHVTCPENEYTVDCYFRQCTCTHVAKTCTAVRDCTGDCRLGWHCLDAKCRCGFGFGGGK